MTLDLAHVWSFTIGTTTYWPLQNSVRMTESAGGEIDTLTVELYDPDGSIAIQNWSEIVWEADSSPIFGGYVVSHEALPLIGAARNLSIKCESYNTLFNKGPLIQRTFVHNTPAQIIPQLFTDAEVTGFNTSTHVASAPELSVFTVPQRKLSQALDDLAIATGLSWKVDAEKNLWFQAGTVTASPFNVADGENSDEVTIFPATAGTWKHKKNSDDPRNKIVVHGGFTLGPDVADTFNGDGSTTLFNLTYQRIKKVVGIYVDNIRQRHGVLGWHDFITDQMDVLVDYLSGTMEFYGAPDIGTGNVEIIYNYEIPLEWSGSDAASIAAWGRTFTYHVWDSSISNESHATAVINQLLEDYAVDQIDGSFAVEKLGLRPGQLIHLQHTSHGINGYYEIQKVTTEIRKATAYVRCQVTYGSVVRKLSTSIQIPPPPSAYPGWLDPAQSQEIEDSAVRGALVAGVGRFIPPVSP